MSSAAFRWTPLVSTTNTWWKPSVAARLVGVQESPERRGQRPARRPVRSSKSPRVPSPSGRFASCAMSTRSHRTHGLAPPHAERLVHLAAAHGHRDRRIGEQLQRPSLLGTQRLRPRRERLLVVLLDDRLDGLGPRRLHVDLRVVNARRVPRIDSTEYRRQLTHHPVAVHVPASTAHHLAQHAKNMPGGPEDGYRYPAGTPPRSSTAGLSARRPAPPPVRAPVPPGGPRPGILGCRRPRRLRRAVSRPRRPPVAHTRAPPGSPAVAGGRGRLASSIPPRPPDPRRQA